MASDSKMEREFDRKILKRSGILLRSVVFSWILIAFTITVFVLLILTYQRKVLVGNLETTAKVVATSIAQVTTSAIISEDYSFVVDQCLKVLQEKPVVYVVATRRDGFSLVHTKGSWGQKQLGGFWSQPAADFRKGKFIKSELVGNNVFQFSYPLTYSGIDWGYIHIGLSLEKFYADQRNMYLRTIFSALLCVLLGLIPAILFARRLSYPIYMLKQVTQRVGEGDLSARAKIFSRDELGELSEAFNKMTESLQTSINERKDLEADLKKKVDSLERFNKVSVDRELKMIQLKKEIEELKKKPEGS